MRAWLHGSRSQNQKATGSTSPYCWRKRYWTLLASPPRHAAPRTDLHTSTLRRRRRMGCDQRRDSLTKARCIPLESRGIRCDKDTITLSVNSFLQSTLSDQLRLRWLRSYHPSDLCMMPSMEFIIRIPSVLASFPRVVKDTAILEFF